MWSSRKGWGNALFVALLLAAGLQACRREGRHGEQHWHKIYVQNDCRSSRTFGVRYFNPDEDDWENDQLWVVAARDEGYLLKRNSNEVVVTNNREVYYYVQGVNRGEHRFFYDGEKRRMRAASPDADRDILIDMPCTTGTRRGGGGRSSSGGVNRFRPGL